MLEERRDMAEQEELTQSTASIDHSADTSSSANTYDKPANVHIDGDVEMSNSDDQLDNGDEQFFRYLQELQDGHGEPDGVDVKTTDYFDDVEDDAEEEELNEPKVNHYLPDDLDENIGSAQCVMGTYVRVVHLNGIHNISMISCSCQGSDHLANDLIASQLLLASFERICTIFTTQLLDYFCLLNLELKAMAYQFYHLLQQLTNPLDPASVVDLYREFRRMSRIWRWMKHLKSARIGTNNVTADKVLAGQLYESKFILDSFIFRVSPARFLRRLAAIINIFPRSRVYSCH